MMDPISNNVFSPQAKGLLLSRARGLISGTQDLMRAALDWLLPPECPLCKKNINLAEKPVCDDCYTSLPHRRNNCDRCGQPYAYNLDYCGRCIASPPPYDACFCAFEYGDPIARLIRRLKYFEHPELAEHLAIMLQQEIENYQIELPELLIPVPIHISKLRQRGFNQSLLLTQAISKLMNIPYASDIIVKSKATPAQADLPLRMRRKNLKGSFEFRKKTNAKQVVIIDDVITTGSTVAEITKILKRNGVEYVQVWGIAQKV